MDVVSICSGIGAADLGLQAAVGGHHRTVLYVEREARNAAVLVARMEDQILDRAPIWDDLTTLDGRSLRGTVDLVSAGLPCQPYSVAGKGAADADERALWPHLVRVVREAEPAFVFLENVPGFRKHSQGVYDELVRLGFGWAPPLVQDAHSFGAPHRRDRLFLLAAHPERVAVWLESGGKLRPNRAARAAVSGTSDLVTAYSDGRRLESEWGGWVLDGERETLRHDPDRCHLRASRGSACRICGTQWAAESPVLRVDDGPADRVDRLRAIGNVGTPPIGYAVAFLTLYTSLFSSDAPSVPSDAPSVLSDAPSVPTEAP